MDQNKQPWQSKLAAWTHDPAEKALVLLRDPAGHEGGTVRVLQQQIFPNGLPAELSKNIKRADWWASAADRPQFPLEADGGRFQRWAQVRFDENPILIHPLSGQSFDLKKLDIDPDQIKTVSADHFQSLILRDQEGNIDWRRTALNFWRFGPESPASDLGVLWNLLPADTRVPDHTIWSHLDLTSAFASAFELDEKNNPALLTMSFGPVQDFIAQARTTSDLWAGSHLLSCLVWEGLKVLCERLGPDAVIFPQLRGVPLVDLWLQEAMELPAERFAQMEWRTFKNDTNPLFAAALPNKFVAIVPADQAAALAETVTEKVRGWVQAQAKAMLTKLLEVAGEQNRADLPCWQQLETQLRGFPEIHWAAIPWEPLIKTSNKGLDTTELEQATAPFSPDQNQPSGFLGSDAWKVLSSDIDIEKARFYRPNPGVLYPAVYELLERVAAASKAIRPFEQNQQTGYRCSLSGETEWLTTDRSQLDLSPGKRKDIDTLWNRIADRRPAWARKGEHLGTLAMLKRLWPTQFVKEIKPVLDRDLQRFVVSTHTLALSASLARWLDQPGRDLPDHLASQLENQDTAALPRKLALQLDRKFRDDHAAQLLARKLPAYLDRLQENLAGAEADKKAQAEQCLRQAEADIKQVFNGDKPEAYYALIMMDGDRMGAWLSGGEPDFLLSYQDTWHPQIKNAIPQRFQNRQLQNYLQSRRAISPSRHVAISAALNGFALRLARHVVEELGNGKLLYAGGDDVLAMVSIDDLLPIMLLLRLVYSGVFPTESAAEDAWKLLLDEKPKGLAIGNGHVLLKNHLGNHLYRTMGSKATASTGAVIAHHTAPLSAVLRTLRQTEQRAKKQGGRDAFAITVLKRSGGVTDFTCPWFETQIPPEGDWRLESTPMGLLLELRDVLADTDMSRRAAYLIQDWVTQMPLAELPNEQHTDLLAQNLAYQLQRQGGEKQKSKKMAVDIARIALAVGQQKPGPVVGFIRDLFTVAEFLARNGRAGTTQTLHREAV